MSEHERGGPPATADELIGLIAQRRGISREEAREKLAAMPGGMELLAGLAPELSPLADELRDDPG